MKLMIKARHHGASHSPLHHPTALNEYDSTITLEKLIR